MKKTKETEMGKGIEGSRKFGRGEEKEKVENSDGGQVTQNGFIYQVPTCLVPSRCCYNIFMGHPCEVPFTWLITKY